MLYSLHCRANLWVEHFAVGPFAYLDEIGSRIPFSVRTVCILSGTALIKTSRKSGIVIRFFCQQAKQTQTSARDQSPQKDIVFPPLSAPRQCRYKSSLSDRIDIFFGHLSPSTSDNRVMPVFAEICEAKLLSDVEQLPATQIDSHPGAVAHVCEKGVMIASSSLARTVEWGVL